MPRYKDVVSKLRAAVDDLESQRITVAPLREHIDELEKQADEVTALEGELDAVRGQIIRPVNEELAQGRTISKFGLIFGALGFLAAIVGAIYPVFREDPNRPAIDGVHTEIRQTNEALSSMAENSRKTNESLKRMMQGVSATVGAAPLFADEVEPHPDEQFYPFSRPATALTSSEQHGRSVGFEVRHVNRITPTHLGEQIMVADVWVLVDGRRVDEVQFDAVVRVESAWPQEVIQSGRRAGTLRVTEEDTLILLDVHEFTVTRIGSTETHGRALADSQSGMWLLPADK